ncbi:MAG TPA: ATP-binding protein [Gaiellales bacterium]|nr:ATP-binding protein [Gaiellales bacterium]
MRSDHSTSGDMRAAEEVFGRLPLEGTLRSVFEGGAEGRRRAVLLFLLMVGVPAVTVTAVVSSHDRVAVTAGRFASLMLIGIWLLVRRAPSPAEWAVLFLGLILGNAAAQLSAGPTHAGVFALNALGVFALICVAFEAWAVVFTAVAYSAAYAVVQFHFYSGGVALAATLMFAIIMLVMGVTVYGTSLYLRTALRRTQFLHLQMDRTAEQERARIAGELHDDTIQVLTAAALRLDDIGRRLDASGSPDSAQLRSVRHMLGQALERTRRLTFELYPATLDQRGLEPSLQVLAHQASADGSFDVQLVVDADGLPGPVAQLAYRTIKELLANAGKHADASRVEIAVRANEHVLAAEVVDNGRGFAQHQLVDARNCFHLGLAATRDRVQAAGGTFDLASAPGKGTRAWFTLPLEPAGTGRRPAA